MSQLLSTVMLIGIASQLVTPLPDGGFEAGPRGLWKEYSELGEKLIYPADQLPAGVAPKNGNWVAWLGGENDEIAFIQQAVDVPGGVPALTLWFWTSSSDRCGADYAQVLVNGAVWTMFDLCRSQNSTAWTRVIVNFDAYASQMVDLKIQVETDSSNFSSFFLDDLAWESADLVLETPTSTGNPTPTLPQTPTTQSQAVIPPTNTAAVSFAESMHPTMVTTQIAVPRITVVPPDTQQSTGSDAQAIAILPTRTPHVVTPSPSTILTPSQDTPGVLAIPSQRLSPGLVGVSIVGLLVTGILLFVAMYRVSQRKFRGSSPDHPQAGITQQD